MKCTLSVVWLLCAASAASAQTEILIDVDRPVLNPGESTTVTLRAGYPSDEFAMAGVGTHLLVDAGSAGWSDLRVLAPMHSAGTHPGALSDRGVEDIVAAQLNFPPAGGADRTNPIPFWRATLTAPTDVMRPIEITLMTDTAVYEVYFDRFSAETRSYLAELVEGTAIITVVPAPAAWSACAAAMFAFASRRRR